MSPRGIVIAERVPAYGSGTSRSATEVAWRSGHIEQRMMPSLPSRSPSSYHVLPLMKPVDTEADETEERLRGVFGERRGWEGALDVNG
jgi:hypothetical protein